MFACESNWGAVMYRKSGVKRSFCERYKLFIAIVSFQLLFVHTAHAQSFNYTGSAQTNIISTSGIYSITVAGAAGGPNSVADNGLGAIITGTATLTSGTVLNLIVGGQGLNGVGYPNGWGSGGGGGSFIYSSSSPLVVAGGGGGAGYGGGATGDNASITPSGTGSLGGVAGAGGGANSAAGFGGGGGGGGINSSGANGGSGSDRYGYGGVGGNGGVNAFAGGYSNTSSLSGPNLPSGGYGGGGGGGYNFGGGGGGYSGGAGGLDANIPSGGGGGGGSYAGGLTGALFSIGNAGDGYIILTFLQPISLDIAGINITVSQTTNTSTSTNLTANLSGAVTVNVANGAAAYLTNRNMTIVSSTGLSGTFSGVTTSQNLSFLTPNLTYDANNVYLSYSLTPFSTVAKNINERNVGNALTFAALGPVNGLSAPILNSLYYGNYQNAQAVMDTVGGSGLAGVQSAAMQVGEMASSSVSDQIAFWRSGETIDATGVTSQEGNNPRNFIAYAPIETKVPAKGPINLKGPAGSLTAAIAPRTFRAWGSMFGGGANYLSDAGRGAAASNVGFYGGLLGVDYQIQPNLLVGVALGDSNANFNVGSLSTNGNLTGFHAGVYGAYTMGNSYLAINETFSAYTNQTTRKAGGYALLPYEQLGAQFGSTEFRTRAEVGHGVLMGGLKATPFIAAEIAAYQSSGFTENSSTYVSSFALQNNGQVINSLPTFAGLRLSNAFTLSNGWRLAPVGSVAYVHEFFPQRQSTNMLISMPGTDFNVSGPRSTYNLVQTKMGVQLNLNQKLAMFTDFQGEFSPVSQSYAGKVGVKYVW